MHQGQARTSFAAGHARHACRPRPPPQALVPAHRRRACTCKCAPTDGSSPSPKQQQQQEFTALVEQLLPLLPAALRQLQDCGVPHPAFSASFLFWLAAEEKAAHGPRKEELAELAAKVVMVKEQAEFEASRRQLPPLASSLAYANYRSWASTNAGQELPDVAPGVSLTDLYRAGEREEALLKQWQAPSKPRSTLDSFANGSGYQQMATEAMARARARLLGYEDDDTLVQRRQQQPTGGPGGQQQEQPSPGVSPAAERVLDELLLTCCCREERATLLPEAFVPPGLEVSASGSTLTGSSTKARVVTAPRRLQEAIAAKLRDLGHQPDAAPADAAGAAQQRLPSGEGTVQALLQLQEDVHEYDVHVYRRMPQRDRL